MLVLDSRSCALQTLPCDDSMQSMQGGFCAVLSCSYACSLYSQCTFWFSEKQKMSAISPQNPQGETHPQKAHSSFFPGHFCLAYSFCLAHSTCHKQSKSTQAAKVTPSRPFQGITVYIWLLEFALPINIAGVKSCAFNSCQHDLLQYIHYTCQ